MIFISHQLLRMSVVRLGRNLRAGFREWVSGSLVLCASVGRALACPEGSQALPETRLERWRLPLLQLSLLHPQTGRSQDLLGREGRPQVWEEVWAGSAWVPGLSLPVN